LINDVVLEGIVTREPWKYTDDLFFRLATYRDTDLPPKPLDAERDQADYVNVRVCGGANGLMSIRRGMRLRVHGFLQSRDFRESLSDFLGKAHKAGNTAQIELGEVKPEQILIDRNVVEIVARRLIVLDTGDKK
jgi:hypothetical protein